MKNKMRKIILIIYMCTVLIGVITVSVAAFMSAQKDNSYRGVSDYTEGWTDKSGHPADLMSINKYDCIMKNISEIESEKTVQFYVRSVNVTIYVGDELVFYTPEINHNVFGSTPGAYYAIFTLKPSDSGKVMTVNIESPYGNDGSGKIMEMFIGDGSSITEASVKSKLSGFVVSCAIIFAGLTIIFIYIPLRIKKMAQNSMMYLGLLSVNVGIYMFFDNKLIQLLIGSDAMFHMSAAMWLLFLSVPMLLYFENQYECINAKVIHIFCFMSLVDFLVCYLLHITGTADFHRTLVLTHGVFVVEFLYLLWAMIWTVIHKKKNSILHLISVALIMLGVFTDLLILNFGNSIEQAYFSQLGTLAFMCIEISLLVGTHIVEYQKGMKARLVSRLAYHDGLTDMLNRTSFMEDIENIEKNHTESGRIIAVFDVNYLKRVNDNYGHEKGDELIMLAAQKISQFFTDLGRCYRIGGDEFVCLTDGDVSAQRFENTGKAFAEALRSTRTSTGMRLSIAMGFEKNDPKINRDMKQLFNDADANMYDNKVKMKQQSE